MVDVHGHFRFHIHEPIHHNGNNTVHPAVRVPPGICTECIYDEQDLPVERDPLLSFPDHVNVNLGTVNDNDMQNENSLVWPNINEKVVIKVVSFIVAKGEFLPNEKRREECLRTEITNLMAMKHDNIIALYYAQTLHATGCGPLSASKWYLLYLEHCEEGDLVKHLWNLFKSRKPIPVGDYARQLLRGLDYIHQTPRTDGIPIVHNDVKGPNVFAARKNGRVVLKFGDFEMMVKLTGGLTSARPPAHHCGTDEFKSPEMLHLGLGKGKASKLKVGRLNDIYGLACILLRLVGIDNDPDEKPYDNPPRYYKTVDTTGFRRLHGLARRALRLKPLAATKVYYDDKYRSLSTLVPFESANAQQNITSDMTLYYFQKSGGQIEMKHSSEMVVIQAHGDLFAIRVPQGAPRRSWTYATPNTSLDWLETIPYTDAWPALKKVIKQCLLPLRGPYHTWKYSARHPHQRIRPVAHQLLNNSVFSRQNWDSFGTVEPAGFVEIVDLEEKKHKVQV